MSFEFKPGDKVFCIDKRSSGTGIILTHSVYEVDYYSAYDELIGEASVVLKNFRGPLNYLFAKRFIPADLVTGVDRLLHF